MSDFLQSLNPAQREAAQTLKGPLLILAGAGSGKTRVLTYRMAQLILEGEASPQQVLAVTFTNKAAREMEERILHLLRQVNVPVYDRLWISTFHSTCVRILRDEITALGYQPFFAIYDDGDQLSVIKRIMTEMNLNDKVYPPKQLRAQISNAKMLGLKPEDVPKKSFFLMDNTALEVFQHYENELFRANALDFDDLLLKTYELFTRFPDILAKYREKFAYIMVDEYQDTNRIQYLLIRALAEGHRNLCVVGDEDQSIYSWRGADIRNILDFEKDFPETKIVKLEENYRSTRTIVEAASHLIKRNSQRKDKTLFTQNPVGAKITIQSEATEYDEARFLVRKIGDLRRSSSYSYNDFAVFYRTNAQSRVLEDQLRTYSIPYKVIGTVRFYERQEIKDMICYLRLLLNPTDDVAFYRIINVPARGIGKTTIEVIADVGREHNLPALQAAQKTAETRRVNSGACSKINGFLNLIEKLRAEASTLPPSELYLRVLEETGYALRLKQENTPEAQARIDNLEELQNAILQFEKERGDEATLQAFLEEMALLSELDKAQDQQESVTLMTLHLSKGLEFKNVFIVGMEEGLFPSGQKMDDTDPTAIEEERRLAYVGMTRARENLHLSFAKMRRVWGQEEHRPPSRFINEIPEQYITSNMNLRRPTFLEKYASDAYRAPSAAAGNLASSVVRRPYDPGKLPNYEDFGDDVFEGPASSKSYSKGMRVRHSVFGVGTIFQIEGEGDQQKVSVLFNDRSLKKFMVKYARLDVV